MDNLYEFLKDDLNPFQEIQIRDEFSLTQYSAEKKASILKRLILIKSTMACSKIKVYNIDELYIQTCIECINNYNYSLAPYMVDTLNKIYKKYLNESI